MKTPPIKTILLIDDDPIANLINRKLIEKTLTLKVIVFPNAQDALPFLRDEYLQSAHQPALIFLDINMPQMDGWQFLDEFRNLRANIRSACTVVMLTSSIDLADLEKSKVYDSVADFISKPLTQDKLRSLLG